MDLLLEKIVKSIIEKKGISPALIDISKESNFTDYILIVSANQKQMDILKSEVMKIGKKELYHYEGKSSSGWILLDFGYIVVNIMESEIRQYYNLEKLWAEGEIINLEKFYE